MHSCAFHFWRCSAWPAEGEWASWSILDFHDSQTRPAYGSCPSFNWSFHLKISGILSFEDFRLLHIAQGFWGAPTAKPTTLLLLNADTIITALHRWRVTTELPKGGSVGKDPIGVWATTKLKEYPPSMCGALGEGILAAFDRTISMPIAASLTISKTVADPWSSIHMDELWSRFRRSFVKWNSSCIGRSLRYSEPERKTIYIYIYICIYVCMYTDRERERERVREREMDIK